MQFLVVNRSSVIDWFSELLDWVIVWALVVSWLSERLRASTVKQWILYQTCTGPVVQLLANVYHVVNKNMIGSTYWTVTTHSVLNVRAAPEWGNSELYKYYERNGLGYGTVHCAYAWTSWDAPWSTWSWEEGANVWPLSISSLDHLLSR